MGLVLSFGVYFKCHTLLEHPENRAVLRTCKVLPRRTVSKKTDKISLQSKYHVQVACLKTQHREILGDHSGFGLKLTLKDGGDKFVLCDSGDSAYASEIAEQFDGADLLILHVGTLEKLPGKPSDRGEHLCFHGVVQTLQKLAKQPKKPKLVLLSEWGQEFHEPGLRLRFAELVRKHAGLGVPILPADLGMKVRIPECTVNCTGTDNYVAADRIRVVDYGAYLRYH